MSRPRPLDYLSTVSALQQILQNLEVSLDKARAEEENEWKVRYDVHLRFKRCLEMRMHRSLERTKSLREALRDGGLEYHRDYWMTPEHAVVRLVYSLERQRKEKLAELEKKEDLLDQDGKVLKEERNRRRLLQQELDSLKVGLENLPWYRSSSDRLQKTTDDALINAGRKRSVEQEMDDLQRQISLEARHGLPHV